MPSSSTAITLMATTKISGTGPAMIIKDKEVAMNIGLANLHFYDMSYNIEMSRLTIKITIIKRLPDKVSAPITVDPE